MQGRAKPDRSRLVCTPKAHRAEGPPPWENPAPRSRLCEQQDRRQADAHQSRIDPDVRLGSGSKSHLLDAEAVKNTKAIGASILSSPSPKRIAACGLGKTTGKKAWCSPGTKPYGPWAKAHQHGVVDTKHVGPGGLHRIANVRVSAGAPNPIIYSAIMATP